MVVLLVIITISTFPNSFFLLVLVVLPLLLPLLLPFFLPLLLLIFIIIIIIITATTTTNTNYISLSSSLSSSIIITIISTIIIIIVVVVIVIILDRSCPGPSSWWFLTGGLDWHFRSVECRTSGSVYYSSSACTRSTRSTTIARFPRK